MTVPIEFFYFDLGNVIYHFDYTIANEKTSVVLGCEPHEVHRAIYQSGLEELFETGFVSPTRFAQECARSLGRDIDVSTFLRTTSDMFTFNRDIARVIRYLNDKSIPIGLLSNTCASHWNWICDLKDVDFDCFSQLILSFEVGCMKPFPAIYQAAENAAAVAPERIAFIDDREANIQAAADRGWQTLLFNNVDQTLEWLRQRV